MILVLAFLFLSVSFVLPKPYRPEEPWLQEPSTNVSDISLLLYTRNNPLDEQVLEFDVGNVSSSFYQPSASTKILVHGYNDDGRVSWIRRTTALYLEKEDCNVISVDWEKLAGPAPFYFIAAENTKRGGYHVAQFIQFLVDNMGADLSSFHPIGYSLGAQLVGHLGYGLDGRLSRITGLDPAGFLFHTVPDSERLSKGDAAFVDVIHSAGLWIGTDEVVGDVDFYPNSGMAPQPGCEDENIGLGCSHARAPAYFIESINSTIGFESVRCTSWEDFEAGLCDDNPERNFLGDPADPTMPGVFYLKTNPSSPYARPFP